MKKNLDVVLCFLLIIFLTFLLAVQEKNKPDPLELTIKHNDGVQKEVVAEREHFPISVDENKDCVVSQGVYQPSNVVTISENGPRIQVYEHFLSDEECEYIINLGVEKGLSRSMVASEKNVQSNVRTSYGVFLTDPDPVLRSIEERIALWAKIPVENGEPYYLLRYEVGQEYKPHYDYFDPSIKGMENYLGAAGQRIATALLYLEIPDEGGETIFPNAKPPLSVKAVRGTAVLFWSLTPDNKLDTTSLHGSVPVLEGIKYCCTKWVRENAWRR